MKPHEEPTEDGGGDAAADVALLASVRGLVWFVYFIKMATDDRDLVVPFDKS